MTGVFTLELAQRRHRADHRRRARHVALHGLHARAGLEREPTGVEDHSLADERERLAAGTGRRVRELQEPRGLRGALTHAQHAAELLLTELRHVEHLHGDAATTEEAARFRRDLGRWLGLRGLVDEIARPRRPRRRSPNRAPSAARTSAPPSLMTLTFASCDGLAVALVLEELVRAEHHSLGHRLRGFGGAEIGRRRSRAWWRPTPPCGRGGQPRLPARRRPSSVSSSSSPTPTSTAALALSFPDVGTDERLAQVGLEARLVEERHEPAARARRRRRRRPARGCGRCRSSRSAPRAIRPRRGRRVS